MKGKCTQTALMNRERYERSLGGEEHACILTEYALMKGKSMHESDKDGQHGQKKPSRRETMCKEKPE